MLDGFSEMNLHTQAYTQAPCCCAKGSCRQLRHLHVCLSTRWAHALTCASR